MNKQDIKWIFRFLFLIVLSATILLSGCDNSNDGKEDKILSIGVILPLDNDNGLLRENAVRTAIAEINANGGISDDYRIELIVASSEGNDRASAAVAAANQIVNTSSNLVGFISSYSSSTSGIISWMSDNDPYPLISGSGTADELSGISDYFRRLVPPDSLQARACNQLVEQYNIQSVALAIQEGDNFSEGLAARFKEYYSQSISAEIKFSDGDTDNESKIDQMLANNPEAIFILMLDAGLCSEFLSRLQQRSSEYDFSGVYFILADALHSESILDNSLDFMTGSINGNPQNFGVMSAPDTSTTAYLYFADQLMQRYGQMVGSFNAQFYDAAYIFALAMEEAAKTIDPDDEDAFRVAVNTAIYDVCNAESTADAAVDPSYGWASMKQLVAAGAVDYSGASGNCDIDENGNTLTPYQVFTIHGTQGNYRFCVIDYYTP